MRIQQRTINPCSSARFPSYKVCCFSQIFHGGAAVLTLLLGYYSSCPEGVRHRCVQEWTFYSSSKGSGGEIPLWLILFFFSSLFLPTSLCLPPFSICTLEKVIKMNIILELLWGFLSRGSGFSPPLGLTHSTYFSSENEALWDEEGNVMKHATKQI